jgi:hypothetical protein
MSNPIVKEVNAETGEEIEREMTEQEAGKWFIAQELEQERLTKEAMAKEAKEEAILIAKAKFVALGLTTEDLKALGL